MNLKGLVAVSGKPGLWKALAQNKTGFILESLDAQKTKLVANISTAKLAALDEITVFGYEGDLKLKDILHRIKLADHVPDPKADGLKLRQFFREVAPDHDEEKVYASDMKKIIGWFNILKELPLFDEADPAAEPEIVAEPEPVATPEPAIEAVVAEPTAIAEAEDAPVKKAKKAKAAAADGQEPTETAKPKAPKKKKEA